MDMAGAALNDLYEIGPDAAPMMTATALTNRNPQVRDLAVCFFEILPQPQSASLQVLTPCLFDTDVRVRLAAASTLTRVTNPGRFFAAALLNALQRETNSLVSISLIFCLGHCGTNAQDAVPTLLKMTRTPSSARIFPTVRQAAIKALKSIEHTNAAPDQRS
jgi:HEAT repeat protein